MNFVSLEFLIFGVSTLFLYWVVKDKLRVLVLLTASYIFYCFWDWRFSALLIFLTVTNFDLTRRMHENKSDKIRKHLLILCLSQNLLVLFVFKYFNFFIDGAQDVFNSLGFNLDLPTARILLPLGLSFLIFQTSSYIIDVYRGKTLPEKSFSCFATFVVYFPHMAAGPIMPAKVLLPQISSRKVPLNVELVQSAFFLIGIGLFRKIVIADTLAPLVNRIFGNPASFDWKSILIASIAFGLQIYGDFAGYSSIARGVSRLFGIEMMINFKQPYLSTSITDFWRRWHVSLSSWFRDYLYIPLGGNKGKPYKTYLNLLIVMTIAGLWHGAALGFLVWGFLHGVFLVIDKRFRFDRPSSKLLTFSALTLGWIVTQLCVLFAWIFFRNPELNDAFLIIKSLLYRNTGVFEIGDGILVATAFIVSFTVDLAEIHLAPKLQRSASLTKGLLIGVILVIVFTMKSSSVIPFIYFGF